MTDPEDKEELQNKPEGDTSLEHSDAEQTRQPLTGRDWLSIAFPAIGGLLCLYSMYLILFGADYVTVNRFTGPTFWQLLLLNPSILTMVGIVVTMLGRAVRTK